MADGCSVKRLHSTLQVLDEVGHSFEDKLALNEKCTQSTTTDSTIAGQKNKDNLKEELGIPSTVSDRHLDSSEGPIERDVCACGPSQTKSTGVSFDIEIGDSSVKQPPKRLLEKTKRNKNVTATLEILNNKQLQAEKRRKQQRQDKLQRIHDRQEAARKLAENVDILLQQRALSLGVADENVKRLPSRDIMATAHQVAQNFRDVTNQLGKDLSVNERVEAKKLKVTCPKNETGTGQKKSSTSFTVVVPCDTKAKSKRPILTPKKKKVLTVEELEEKQRKAEQRRKARQDKKVQRIQENREALMQMSKDIERFESLQHEMETASPNERQTRETALLADRIAAGFGRLSQRYSEDLKRAENFFLEQPYVVGP